MATVYSGSDAGKSGLEMVELDGSPDVRGVSKIKVSNTTLTDNGNGEVTLITGGGGGGGAVDSVSMGTTGLTPSTATTGAVVVAGTLNVANGGTGATTDAGARTNLGLGTMATQDANAVAITGGTISGVSGVGSPSVGSANQFNVADGSGGWDPATVYYHNAGGGGIKIGSSSLPDYPIAATTGNNDAYVGRLVSQGPITRLAFVSSTTTNNASVAIGTQNQRLLLTSNLTDYLFPLTDGSSGDVLTTDGAGNLSFTTPSGGGGFTPSRTQLSGTTASIPPAAIDNVDFTGGTGQGCKFYNLFQITSDTPAWVRLYITSAARTADSGRSQGTPPAADAGVIAEAIFTAAGTIDFTPAVVGWNGDATPANTIYVAVTNNDAGPLPTTISVDLDFLSLEE